MSAPTLFPRRCPLGQAGSWLCLSESLRLRLWCLLEPAGSWVGPRNRRGRRVRLGRACRGGGSHRPAWNWESHIHCHGRCRVLTVHSPVRPARAPALPLERVGNTSGVTCRCTTPHLARSRGWGVGCTGLLPGVRSSALADHPFSFPAHRRLLRARRANDGHPAFRGLLGTAARDLAHLCDAHPPRPPLRRPSAVERLR